MEHKLTELEINKICANLRAVDFFRKHRDEIAAFPDMLAVSERFEASVKELMSYLTEEQIDHVLEIHKIQAEAIEKKIARKEKRDKKKQNTEPTK